MRAADEKLIINELGPNPVLVPDNSPSLASKQYLSVFPVFPRMSEVYLHVAISSISLRSNHKLIPLPISVWTVLVFPMPDFPAR